MRFIELVLKNSILLNLLTIVIVVTGAITGIRMNREAFPAIDFDTVAISTQYPGASPREVELYVTDPIEKELSDVSGIEDMSSTSSENYSLIILKIDPNLSEKEKSTTTNNIQRAIDRVRGLPKQVTESPLLTEINSGVMPIMELALSGDYSYEELHKRADELIEKIEGLEGAKKPLKYGFYDKEFWVEVDPAKLKDYNISLNSVIAALAAKNINLPGGIIKSPDGDLIVRTIGEITSTKELEEVVIRSSPNLKLRVKDIGEAKRTFEESDRFYRTNGQASINLIIRKQSTGDIITLVSEVKRVAEEFKNLPGNEGLKLAFANDLSFFVKNRLGVLVNNGVFGVILVLLCLLLFLSKGIALVAALGMPVALLGAVVAMNYLGMTINLLTLFAMVIVLGMLVDDAIIVAENIWRHYEEGASAWEATVKGTSEVIWPVTTTILTTIAAFSPLLMVTGIFGKFVESLPKVVIVSLVISLIEAMFILPSHAYDILKFYDRRKKAKKDAGQGAPEAKVKPGFMHRLTEVYGRVLHWSLKTRYLTIAMSLMVFFAALFVASNMKTILFPTDGVEVFYLRANLKEGTASRETMEKMKAFESVLEQSIPPSELKDYVTYVGVQQNDAVDPLKSVASHVAQIGVYLSPEKARSRKADQIIESIRPKVMAVAQKEGFANVHFSKQQMGPPIGKPVAIRIFGKNFDRMNKVADEISSQLAEIEGVSDVSKDYIKGKKELHVYIDEGNASRALLTTQDIATHVRASLQGQIASYIYNDSDKIPVRVLYRKEDRSSVSSIADSYISNQMGNQVPVQSVVKFQEAEGVIALKHKNNRRVVTITAAIDEDITTSTLVNEAIEPHISQILASNPELKIERGGEYEDTNKSLSSLALSFAFALSLVFVILATQFKSLTQPLVVMSAVPFGLIGVIAAFKVHGLPLSFIGFIGMIGLSGVVVNDSIVLVDFINKAMNKGMSAFDAVMYGGKRRFRAVWLTSMTTIFGLLPLAYGIGGDDVFLRPAAMALGYGLIFSTVLILILVPSLYLVRIDIMRGLSVVFGSRKHKPRVEV